MTANALVAFLRFGAIGALIITASATSGCISGKVLPPAGQATAPRMVAPTAASSSTYYPDASRRANETGLVVLHFSVAKNGKAEGPFLMDDKAMATAPSVRLINAAELYLRHADFETNTRHEGLLTASVIFELEPCGSLKHAPIHDYAINLCRDRSDPGPANVHY